MSSVAVLGATTAITLAAASLIAVMSLVPAAHTARAAADSAALAAADTLLWREGEPCDSAERLAAAHGAQLLNCACEGLDCKVTARLTALGIPLTASARAGAD